MMATGQLRQTAYKVWISQIISSNFILGQDEWEPNYFMLNGNKVSRVNIIASVILKYQNENGGYTNITIDDGSSNIRVKAWREDVKILNKINVGDLILVVGRVRKSNDETYISPEIIKKLENSAYARLRVLELKKFYGEQKEAKPKESPIDVNQEKMYQEELIEGVTSIKKRQKILSLIESLDTENGVDVFDVINNSKMNLAEAQGVLSELIRDGEVFEISSNRIKLVK